MNLKLYDIMAYNRDETIELGLFTGQTSEEAYDRAYNYYEDDYHIDHYEIDITEISLASELKDWFYLLLRFYVNHYRNVTIEIVL